MSNTTASTPQQTSSTPSAAAGVLDSWLGRVAAPILIGLAIFSFARIVTDTPAMSNFQTWGALLRVAMPLLLVGLGGLFAERAGVVNIGLEGMMILGTWFTGYGAFMWGPWRGVLFGMLGGVIGAAIHALATVTFKIDHIVSGVAINIVGFGIGRFLSTVAYAGRTDAGVTKSPSFEGSTGKFTIPGFSRIFEAMEDTGWFLVGDIGGILHGWTTNISYFTLLGILLVPASFFVLWKTSFGLRLRSCGENPWAAESLGVKVYMLKWIAVLISGAFAGLGGAYLVTEQAGLYREGMTGGRGFIGLAAMIFGNWRPAGIAVGAAVFGYGLTLQIRGEADSIRALILAGGIGLILYAGWQLYKREPAKSVGVTMAIGLALIVVFRVVKEVPAEFTAMAPYVLTLVVVSSASSRLRMPSAVGQIYRRGDTH